MSYLRIKLRVVQLALETQPGLPDALRRIGTHHAPIELPQMLTGQQRAGGARRALRREAMRVGHRHRHLERRAARREAAWLIAPFRRVGGTPAVARALGARRRRRSLPKRVC